ncbi:MAG TPA: 4Fe-4S double cluster binding domain-containing protein [Dissulfurispiraceae bacterium]|nr:4Fe-4S double cluster binding domain-containing protein [Dissulfurispiraceae bacterium]
MTKSITDMPAWFSALMSYQKGILWGIADLGSFDTPKDDAGRGFPSAVSFAVHMPPQIMLDIQSGPNQAYAEEYARVNVRIDSFSEALAEMIRQRGYRSKPLASSLRTDAVNVRGDFPHKTAATRAGLGWIGRNCQLVTRARGPWIRLGTVFTDMPLPPATPVVKSFCGRCRRCVDACPAGALKDTLWYPGTAREEILDFHGCDQWKKEHYYQYHKGHNCGICSAVCPYGVKLLKR